ncbi:DNA topoisomerase, partial [Francisella tularensis subsp. holarctica]|uniref:DNA topoisomerase n=1 Tax=Francisella tularensis TaxID=263 RepID=UPI002381C0D4
LIVDGITEKKTRRYPYPQFITSTLQQEASKKLGFTAKRTMSTAHKLYEGIDLGNGESVGLISYMRTDSTNLSNDALNDIRNFI